MSPDQGLNPTLDLSIGPKGGQLPSFSLTGLLPVVFLIIFVVWAIYSLILAYHWFRYGHQSWLAVPVIVAHLFVSGAIIVFIMSGLR